MRELRIELPNYEKREQDANTIMLLASRYDLEYDAAVNPILTVTDTATDKIILTSSGTMRCYVSGEERNIEKFLKELESWFTEF